MRSRASTNSSLRWWRSLLWPRGGLWCVVASACASEGGGMHGRGGGQRQVRAGLAIGAVRRRLRNLTLVD